MIKIFLTTILLCTANASMAQTELDMCKYEANIAFWMLAESQDGVPESSIIEAVKKRVPSYSKYLIENGSINVLRMTHTIYSDENFAALSPQQFKKLILESCFKKKWHSDRD